MRNHSTPQALKSQEHPRPFRRFYCNPLFYEGWGLMCEEIAYETGFFKGARVVVCSPAHFLPSEEVTVLL